MRIASEKDKPDIATLAHFGVKGMKWGVRKAAPTANQIYSARRRVETAGRDIRKQQERVDRATSTGNKANAQRESVKLNAMKASLLRNPDRATALRMTNGEKAMQLTLGTVVLPGVGTGISAATIAARSIGSRVVAKRQASGYYDKKK